jgi:hypothetical protein
LPGAVFVLFSVALLLFAPSHRALAQNRGAIFTTTASGTTVNGNQYAGKEAVYLNGGPNANANCNAAGLPDGRYFFQVTDPSCSFLLSSDPITNREVVVTNGKISGTTGTHTLGSAPCPGARTVQLAPFLNTPNPGGEYKVWLTPTGDYAPGKGCFGFQEKDSKTDNFKVRAQVEPPPPPLTVQCSGNLNVCNDAGQCGARVTFPAATASGGTAPVVVSSDPPSGALFTVGTTMVTCTARDARGTVATCSFSVTVRDCEAPRVTCPGGTTASCNADCRAAVPNLLPNVTATDNCTSAGSLIKSQDPAAGTMMGIGSYMITVRVRDAAGNEGTCSSSFTVRDTTPPVVTCPGDMTANADAQCQARIPNLLAGLTASDNCTPSGSLVKSQDPAAGTVVGLGQYTITARVRDAAGNEGTCSLRFSVLDRTPPVVTCPAGTVTSADARCQARIPDLLGGITASDNCTAVGSLVKSQDPAPGTVVGLGRYTITVRVRDQAGNEGTCTSTFTVNDTTPPVVSCPGNVTDSADASCRARVPDVLGGVSASDNCTPVGSLFKSQDPAAGSWVGLGQHTITVRVRDAAGNEGTCTLRFTVRDTTPPTAICPQPTVASAGNDCQAAVPNVLGSVIAADNCTAAGSLFKSQDPAAGARLGLGSHTITVKVRDEAGNECVCTTTFTVRDTSPPAVTCPGRMVVSADGDCRGFIPDILGSVEALDNCSPARALYKRQEPGAGTSVGLGSHTITVRVRDEAGNEATCTTQFVVNDTTPPVVSCPVSMAAAADSQCQARIPDVVGQITCSDNCTAARTLVKSQSPAGGALVGLGTHTITVRVMDEAGNAATCTTAFTVRLEARICGLSFYDRNANRRQDEGEPGIAGWKIQLNGPVTMTRSTGPDGRFCFEGLPTGEYTVYELGPNELNWVPTTPTFFKVSLSCANPASEGNLFGDVCTGPGPGARSPGFWASRNGRDALLDGDALVPELALLCNLNLVDENGNAFDPATFEQLSDWLQGGNATNMAYQLSRQLAAMALNVEAGFVSAAAIVDCGIVLDLNTIGDPTNPALGTLLQRANAALANDSLTPAQDPNREPQELLKSCLDMANNNNGYVQLTACPLSFP